MATKRVDTCAPRANVPFMDVNKSFWIEFFELYKSLPSLWCLKHPDYSNREIKAIDYNKLANKLKELYPDANRDLVVRKINNYRTSFRKELQKLREHKREGKQYTPTLWYFNELSFLIDQVHLLGSKTSKNETIKTVEEKMPTPIKRKLLTQEDNETINSIREEGHSSTQYLNFEEEYLPGPLPTLPKKKPITSPQPNVYQTKEMPQSNQQATAEILAKSWAVQYGEMQGEQKLIARKLISDILFHGCLGTLEMSHTMRIQDILLNESVTNYHHPYYMDSHEAMEHPGPKVEYVEEDNMVDNCSTNSET